jgi:hypothetical protein
MITSRRIPIALASAVAALAIGLAAPASATDLAVPGKTVQQAQTTRIVVPAVPRARPTMIRKRLAAKYRMRLLSARPVAPFPAPITRIAAHWPILMLGIGY